MVVKHLRCNSNCVKCELQRSTVCQQDRQQEPATSQVSRVSGPGARHGGWRDGETETAAVSCIGSAFWASFYRRSVAQYTGNSVRTASATNKSCCAPHSHTAHGHRHSAPPQPTYESDVCAVFAPLTRAPSITHEADIALAPASSHADPPRPIIQIHTHQTGGPLCARPQAAGGDRS